MSYCILLMNILTVKTFEDLDRVVMYRNWGVHKKGPYSWET